MIDPTASHTVARVDAAEVRFGDTYVDVGPRYRSRARVLGWVAALVLGVPAVIGTALASLLFGLPWWVPVLVLAGTLLLGAAASAIATAVPARQVKSRVTVTSRGMRWNHATGGPTQPAEWRAVRWDRVRSLRRVRHVDEGTPETNGLEIALADGTWTTPVPARHRDFWFRVVADAHRRGLVPDAVALVGFDRMPAPGEPLAPTEWYAPRDGFVELEGTRLQPSL